MRFIVKEMYFLLAVDVSEGRGLKVRCSDVFLFFSSDFIPDFPYEPDAYDDELLR